VRSWTRSSWVIAWIAGPSSDLLALDDVPQVA